MSDRTDLSQLLKVDAQISNSGLDKLRNELTVLSDGLSQSGDGIVHAAQKAAHDPKTLLKIGASAAMGLGLGILAGRTGKLGLLGRSLGIAATASFVVDGVKPFYNAATTTWSATSQSQLDKAGRTLGDSLGAFTVDAVIQTPGAMLGGGLAHCFEAGRGVGLLRQSGLLEGIKSKKFAFLKTPEEMELTGIDFRGAVLETISSREPLVSGSKSTLATALTGSQSHGSIADAATNGATPVREQSVAVTTKEEPLSQVMPAEDATSPAMGQQAAPSIVREQIAPSTVHESPASPAVWIAQPENKPVLTLKEAINHDDDIKQGSRSPANAGGNLERVSVQRNETNPDGDPQQPTAQPVYAAPKIKLVTSSGNKIYGFDFVEIKKTDTEIPYFDMGVGIEDDVLLAGRKNAITARHAQENDSLALSALYLSKARVGRAGQTLAITERNADSLTALAILANRFEHRGINEGLVKLVADRGIGGLNEQALKGYKAISLISEKDGIKIGDRVRFIRAVLDGSVTNADLDARATEYDTLRRAAISEEIQAQKWTGVRNFRGQLVYSYHQAPARDGFEYAIGTSDPNLVGNAKIIDQQGSLNIVERALQLPEAEVPPPGAGILFAQAEVNRLTAAAILENRAEMTPMRRSLLDFILRRGSQPQRIPDAERENVVAAYEAMEGFADDPHIHPGSKVAAIKNLLSRDVPAEKLKPLIEEFSIFRVSQQPYRYVRTNEFKPKPFDFGVEITDPSLVRGQPNLLHPETDMPSAAEQALLMDPSQLPRRGARVAVQKPDADALTAIAVMANRIDGMPVNERLVEAVGRRDRGLDSDPDGNSYDDIEAPFVAIRSFARNKNILIHQRIAAIRALLAGTMRETELRGLVDRFNTHQSINEARAEQTSTITEHIPGKMVYVETPMENWYHARDLGLKQAPVAVIAARQGDRTHFEVLTRSDDPISQQIGSALPALQALEPGWGGHDYIFVSPGSSQLTPQQVLDIVTLHGFGPDALK